MAETEKLTFNVAEVSKLTGLCRGSVYSAIRRGDIPYLRVGKRILVPRSALEKKLEAGS